jgi:dolichol-phosphate mannosyltransferase
VLSIIVPTYREADNIQPLVRRIRAALASMPDYEIIFVDDNSQDGIADRVQELRLAGAPVRLIVREGERGLSSAVFRGFREAQGDLLLCMDADLSHPPESIPLMIETLTKQHADLVVGSRYIPGGSIEKEWGVYRWLNSRVALGLARPLTSLRDATAGFFLLPRRIFEQGRDFYPIGYKVLLEISVKCPCRKVVEVPIRFADRKLGHSKLNFREQIHYLLHLRRLYDYRFRRAANLIQYCVVGATGAGMNLLTLAFLLYCGLPLKLALVLAICAGVSWSFWPNRWLAFDHMNGHHVLPQYLRYLGASAVGAVTNWMVAMALLNLLSARVGYVYWAALGGVTAGTLINWLFLAPRGFPRQPTTDN